MRPRRVPGPAQLAGAKAGPFRRLAGRVERHVLAPGAPRRTNRPAIDPGRGDGVIEQAVGARIAPVYRLPLRLLARQQRVETAIQGGVRKHTGLPLPASHMGRCRMRNVPLLAVRFTTHGAGYGKIQPKNFAASRMPTTMTSIPPIR